MNSDDCPERDAVLAAVDASGLYDDWVQSHLGECAACDAMLSDRLTGIVARLLAARDEDEDEDHYEDEEETGDEAIEAGFRAWLLDGPRGTDEPTRLSENEAALLLTDWASPARPASEITEADRIRLADARNALAQAEAPFARWAPQKVGEVGARPLMIASTKGRPPRMRWSAGMATALIAAAAAALLVVVPADFDERMGDATVVVPPTAELPAAKPPTAELPAAKPPTVELPAAKPPAAELPATKPPAAEPPAAVSPATLPNPAPPKAAPPRKPLSDRSEDVLVGVELSLGEEMCVPLHPLDDPAKPCRWRTADEQLHIHYRREPTARSQYVAVLARDAAGNVQVLYPRSADAQVVLDVTRNRNPEDCPRGLCWLEGGAYRTEKGRFSVAAIFDVKPLPVGALIKTWQPEVWAGPTRKVELFELEVVP